MRSVPAPSSIGRTVFNAVKECKVEMKKRYKTISEREYWVAFSRQGGVMGSSQVNDEYARVH